MLHVSNSNICLISDNNLFCTSFPAKIIIGNVEKCEYIKNQFFEFEKADIVPFCQSICTIVKSIATQKDSKGILVEKSNSLYIYIYEYSKKTLYFVIETLSETVFKVPFNLEEFNEIILIFSQLILPSLCLENDALELLEFVSYCTQDEILNLRSYQDCKQLLAKKHYVLQKNFYCSYILCYIDILVIVNRLRSLYNKDIKIKKITLLFPMI